MISLARTSSSGGALLGLQTRTDVDAFLKDRGVELEYTAEDLERDPHQSKRLPPTLVNGLIVSPDLIGT